MTNFNAESAPVGTLDFKVIRGGQLKRLSLRQMLKEGLPRKGLPATVNAWRARNIPNLYPGLRDVAGAKFTGAPSAIGTAHLMVLRGDGSTEDLGLASARVVTTAGVNSIASHMNNAGATISAYKFIGFGSGATAAAIGDTALQTEYTTQYVVDNTRPTGTQSNPSANVYQCVDTFSPDSGGTLAVTECGVFTAASAGTLLDHFVFSAVNLVASSDSVQVTFQLTFTAGS